MLASQLSQALRLGAAYASSWSQPTCSTRVVRAYVLRVSVASGASTQPRHKMINANSSDPSASRPVLAGVRSGLTAVDELPDVG